MSEEAKQIRAKQYDPGGSYVTEEQLQGLLEMNGQLQPSTHHTFDMVYEIRALRAELAAAQEENARIVLNPEVDFDDHDPRLELVRALDLALHGEAVARDKAPVEVWEELLSEVRRLARPRRESERQRAALDHLAAELREVHANSRDYRVQAFVGQLIAIAKDPSVLLTPADLEAARKETQPKEETMTHPLKATVDAMPAPTLEEAMLHIHQETDEFLYQLGSGTAEPDVRLVYGDSAKDLGVEGA